MEASYCIFNTVDCNVNRLPSSLCHSYISLGSVGWQLPYAFLPLLLVMASGPLSADERAAAVSIVLVVGVGFAIFDAILILLLVYIYCQCYRASPSRLVQYQDVMPSCMTCNVCWVVLINQLKVANFIVIMFPYGLWLLKKN